MPCFSYTLHCTPYTENKKYFLCFFLYLPKGIYLCLFTTSRPRACLIYIHAKPTRRQAIHCAYAYKRVARHIPKLTLITATTHRQSGLWSHNPGRRIHHLSLHALVLVLKVPCWVLFPLKRHLFVPQKAIESQTPT